MHVVEQLTPHLQVELVAELRYPLTNTLRLNPDIFINIKSRHLFRLSPFNFSAPFPAILRRPRRGGSSNTNGMPYRP